LTDNGAPFARQKNVFYASRAHHLDLTWTVASVGEGKDPHWVTQVAEEG
jgi:hypothetical protein